MKSKVVMPSRRYLREFLRSVEANDSFTAKAINTRSYCDNENADYTIRASRSVGVPGNGCVKIRSGQHTLERIRDATLRRRHCPHAP